MTTLHTSGTATDSVTTHDAARILGIAVTTVLNMVERGQLSAWRTPGGHRRIVRSDLDRALKRPPHTGVQPRNLRVLVVEDDEFLLEVYRSEFSLWNLPIDLRLCAGGVSAMLEIGRMPPDLLVTDLQMPEVDGFGIVRTLTGDTRYAGIDTIVISGLSEAAIEQAGGLPTGVVRWGKPIPFGLLRGYLDAKLSQMTKEAAR